MTEQEAASAPQNPFDPAQPAPPYAGRADIIARLHQHLTSAAVPHALTILGRRRSGRTALIEAARRQFGETFVWVKPPLNDLPSEPGWLAAVYHAGKDAAAAHGLSVHRLPRWPDDPTDGYREWFAKVGLPELYQLIRPHRRMVLVIDGAELLSEAIAKAALPADTGAWMSGLLGPQLGIVLTAHIDNESSLARLAPLTGPDYTVRLSLLTEDEIAGLLSHGRGDPDPDMPKQLHALTGGLPELALHAMAAVHEVSRGEAYKPEQLRAVRPQLAAHAVPHFRAVWDNLTADEQAILTALAYLRFESPDKALGAEDVEAWLADSDYPLDLTTIFAVLRRLDFVEIVRNPHNDVQIRAGLFESWIRETVKPEHLRRAGTAHEPLAIDPRLVRYGIIALVTLLVVLLLIVATGQPGPAVNDLVPTVTLGS